MADESLGEKIVNADVAPPLEQAWYTSPQILFACGSVGGGAVAFCAAFHIVIPYSAAEITAGLGGLLAVIGGGFAIYRRLRAGLDPTNSASKITLLPPK